MPLFLHDQQQQVANSSRFIGVGIVIPRMKQWQKVLEVAYRSPRRDLVIGVMTLVVLKAPRLQMYLNGGRNLAYYLVIVVSMAALLIECLGTLMTKPLRSHVNLPS